MTMLRKLREGGWVEDLRPATDGRLGRITVLADTGLVAPRFAQISWGPKEEDLEILNNGELHLVRATRGPVGRVDDLVFTPPPCSCCGHPTDMLEDLDAGWGCGRCGITWGPDGAHGTRMCGDCHTEAAAYMDLDGKARCGACSKVATGLAGADR